MELKLSSKKKPLVSETRRPSPRQVMLTGIKNQLALLADPSFKVSRYRYVDDFDNDGNKTRVKRMIAATPRKWWFEDADGLFYLELRYGSSYVLALEDGKPSICCGDQEDDVVDVLNYVKGLVESGDLDDKINALKAKARRREKS
jgi:hypothetical protein